jgi:hypothetical protein
MDLMTIAAFAAFLVLVVAWMAAPTDAKRLSTKIEPIVVGAD